MKVVYWWKLSIDESCLLMKVVYWWKLSVDERCLSMKVFNWWNLSIGDKAAFLGFLLDPTTHHSVIALTQSHGDLVTEHVCHLTRSWLYIHHRARFRALDLWDALIWAPFLPVISSKICSFACWPRFMLWQLHHPLFSFVVRWPSCLLRVWLCEPSLIGKSRGVASKNKDWDWWKLSTDESCLLMKVVYW